MVVVQAAGWPRCSLLGSEVKWQIDTATQKTLPQSGVLNSPFGRLKTVFLPEQRSTVFAKHVCWMKWKDFTLKLLLAHRAMEQPGGLLFARTVRAPCTAMVVHDAGCRTVIGASGCCAKQPTRYRVQRNEIIKKNK